MGRWAQRNVRGGGPPPGPTIAEMTLAQVEDPGTIRVEYSGPITAALFVEAAFNTDPSNFIPENISQDGANALQLSYTDDISGQANLNYDDGNPEVVDPQNIPITPL